MLDIEYEFYRCSLMVYTVQLWDDLPFCFHQIKKYIVCARSSYPFCIVSYHMEKVTTSWTYSIWILAKTQKTNVWGDTEWPLYCPICILCSVWKLGHNKWTSGHITLQICIFFDIFGA